MRKQSLMFLGPSEKEQDATASEELNKRISKQKRGGCKEVQEKESPKNENMKAEIGAEWLRHICKTNSGAYVQSDPYSSVVDQSVRCQKMSFVRVSDGIFQKKDSNFFVRKLKVSFLQNCLAYIHKLR